MSLQTQTACSKELCKMWTNMLENSVNSSWREKQNRRGEVRKKNMFGESQTCLGKSCKLH